jgi:hypothetical protein
MIDVSSPRNLRIGSAVPVDRHRHVRRQRVFGPFAKARGQVRRGRARSLDGPQPRRFAEPAGVAPLLGVQGIGQARASEHVHIRRVRVPEELGDVGGGDGVVREIPLEPPQPERRQDQQPRHQRHQQPQHKESKQRRMPLRGLSKITKSVLCRK